MRKTIQADESELDPWLFLNAMRAPMTRDRYQARVAKLFNFIGIRGRTLEEKARVFAKKGKSDTNWALANILKFVYFHRERVDKKEITGANKQHLTSSDSSRSILPSGLVRCRSQYPILLIVAKFDENN